MTRRFRPGRRPLACYHEAGHCLARWYFGRQFDRAVVLSPDEIQRGVGLTDRRGRPVTDAEGLMDGYDVLSPYMNPAILEATGGEPAAVAQELQFRSSEGLEFVMLGACAVTLSTMRRATSIMWLLLNPAGAATPPA